MDFKADRRKILKLGMGAFAGALALGGRSRHAFAANECGGETPPQTAGPFYPGETQFTPSSDLIVRNGAVVKTIGQTIHIVGRVHDAGCKSVVGANVEIWQACASGRYNNSTDPNTAPLDPNFKYWGEATTDEYGGYEFLTIIPGAYPADEHWMRPPHIHFKVSKLGYEELITQMYFKGQPLNEKDLILDKVPHSEWDRVIVDFKPEASVEGLVGNFDITLKSIR